MLEAIRGKKLRKAKDVSQQRKSLYIILAEEGNPEFSEGSSCNNRSECSRCMMLLYVFKADLAEEIRQKSKKVWKAFASSSEDDCQF